MYALRTHRERRTELLNLKIVTMKLKVNEAIARSEANGKKVLKKDIAARLFPGVTESGNRSI